MSNTTKKTKKKHHAKKEKEEQILEKIFKLFDEDEDGFVEMTIAAEMLRSAGAIFMDPDLEKPLKKIRSTNGADLLTFDDFKALYADFSKSEETVEDIVEAFKFWDDDGSGKIPVDVVRQSLTTLGDRLNEDEMNAMIKEADPSDIGFIDYEEYSKVLFKKLS